MAGYNVVQLFGIVGWRGIM